jgi:hypothetical protein
LGKTPLHSGFVSFEKITLIIVVWDTCDKKAFATSPSKGYFDLARRNTCKLSFDAQITY